MGRRLVLGLLVLSCLSCRSGTTRDPVAGRIDDALSRMVPFGLSGSVLVANRSGVILSKGYGAGLRADTIYDMGSITKTFTATAIRLLEAEGVLTIDDTLGKFFDGVPADKAGITIRQLLTHTAGIADLACSDYDRISRAELLAGVLNVPLQSQPGTTHSYSNASFSVLAAIVEKASGQDYQGFMRDRLFAPAGMHDTAYTVRPGAETRVARTLTPPVDHGTPLERLQRGGGVHWVLLGNGGMFSTVEDLYRWEQALRTERIVSRAVQDKLFAPLFKRSETVSTASAWIREVVDGEVAFHHPSDAPSLGVNGEYRRYPDSGLVIIFLGNTRVDGSSPRRVVGPTVRKIVGGKPPAVPATEPTAAPALARHAGTYRLPDGATIDVRVETDHLVAGLIGQSAIDLFLSQRDAAAVAVRRELNEKAKRVAADFAWPQAAADPVVLGTAHRGRKAHLTSVRVRFGAEERIYRFSWANDKPTLEYDDAAFETLDFMTRSPIRSALERPLWRERSTNAYVFYDIYTDQTFRVTFTDQALQIGDVVVPRAL